jgi:cAMP-dependent protein kinase regulator
MAKSFLFAPLEDKDFVTVIDAMLKKDLAPKEQIIKEGDDGDCMYIVDQGTLECIKVIGGEPKVVKTCVEGDAFGELALLYNCPRAASVQAGDAQCVIWQLDRETFNAVVKGASMKKREKYDGFIKSVNLLSTLEMYERGQLVDALKPETYKSGDLIVKQGDPGDKFYIVEEGKCAAEKNGTEVMQYSSGDYFGELALLKNEPRAANIIAKADVQVLAVDRATFKALLGPLEDMLKRNTDKYTDAPAEAK